jgi:hypothetical protein
MTYIKIMMTREKTNCQECGGRSEHECWCSLNRDPDPTGKKAVEEIERQEAARRSDIARAGGCACGVAAGTKIVDHHYGCVAASRAYDAGRAVLNDPRASIGAIEWNPAARAAAYAALTKED